MKRKIKSITGTIFALVPFVVLAQIKNPTNTNLPQGSIYNIIEKVMLWLLGLLGFFAVIGFVISGIMYLVAAGDEENQKKAKKAMLYSITGVIVGLVGLVVLVAVQKLLQGQSPNY